MYNKKIFSIFFILATLIVATGCNPPPPQKDDIVGKWSVAGQKEVLIFKPDNIFIIQGYVHNDSNGIANPPIATYTPEIPVNGDRVKPSGGNNTQGLIVPIPDNSGSTAKAPEQKYERQYKYEKDFTKNPKWIDFIQGSPAKRTEAIVKFINENEVEMCMGNEGGARPASFEAGNRYVLRRLAQ